MKYAAIVLLIVSGIQQGISQRSFLIDTMFFHQVPNGTYDKDDDLSVYDGEPFTPNSVSLTHMSDTIYYEGTPLLIGWTEKSELHLTINYDGMKVTSKDISNMICPDGQGYISVLVNSSNESDSNIEYIYNSRNCGDAYTWERLENQVTEYHIISISSFREDDPNYSRNRDID